MASNTADWRDPVPYTELSQRQQEIMRSLWDSASSYPPSMREIGEAVELNDPSSVRYQLVHLEGEGWVRRHPKRPRALEWRRPDGNLLCVPSCRSPLLAPGRAAGSGPSTTVDVSRMG